MGRGSVFSGMKTILRSAPILALSLLAAACGQAGDDTVPQQPAPTPDIARDPAPPAPPPPVPAGMLVPDTLGEADRGAAQLAGELGCSFARNPAEDPLLIAAADVADDARGQALVRIGGAVETLRMDRAGGFNAMSRGARFTGADGLAVDVAVTGSEALVETPRIAMESPRFAATLTYARGGRTIALDGFYECGP